MALFFTVFALSYPHFLGKSLLLGYFASAKALNWLKSITKAAANTFNNLIRLAAKSIATSAQWILNQLYAYYKKVPSGRINIAASAIETLIKGFITLKAGDIIAKIFDRFDRDGQSGYIRF
ncbi:MAG: hypothetical protein IIY70_02930 [Oscillospiraceae bacterium]|nr:hypothetical protein [Oscillospiraceae bacterium]